MKIGYLITFVAGAAAGSFGAWQLTKRKYKKDFETRVQNELEEIKKSYAEANRNVLEQYDEAKKQLEEVKDSNYYFGLRALEEEANHKADVQHYEQILKTCKYNLEHQEETRKPYVIAPEEFGELEYTKVPLRYFADGVLTDELNDPLDNFEIERFVGSDFASHFGEYEDDSVYIRNDATYCDYEILKDLERWDDVIASKKLHY